MVICWEEEQNKLLELSNCMPAGVVYFNNMKSSSKSYLFHLDSNFGKQMQKNSVIAQNSRLMISNENGVSCYCTSRNIVS